MLSSYFSKNSSTKAAESSLFVFDFNDDIKARQADIDEDLCKDDEGIPGAGSTSNKKKKKKKKSKGSNSEDKRIEYSVEISTLGDDHRNVSSDGKVILESVPVANTIKKEENIECPLVSSAEKSSSNDAKAKQEQYKSAKNKKKGKRGNNKKGNKTDEDDDESWFQPQPQPMKNQVTKKSDDEKGAPQFKKSVGTGKNIVAIGQPKVRDPMWLSGVKAENTTKIEGDNYVKMHTNPFSFGFGL